jgi:hypothetical protein
MKLKDLSKFELPPEEHAIGIYIGLTVGGLVLGTGAAVLFRDLLITFTKEGISITAVLLFRILLLLSATYASLACFFGLFRLINLQRMQVRKVDAEFKDFLTYARPLVEEVIRQRIISERISRKLDQLSRLEISERGKLKFERIGPAVEIPKWEEFLLFVALLASISVGLFIYLEMHPWEMVPYSVIILAVAWWILIAKHFDLLYDVRAYYIPSIFILVMPSLSIILRAFMQPYQSLYVVFVIMFFYIWGMYTYFKYLVTGAVPQFLIRMPPKLRRITPSKIRKKLEKIEEVDERLKELLPKKHEKKEEKVKEKTLIQRVKEMISLRRKG